MTIKLEYVIVGYTAVHDPNNKVLELLAYSEGVPSQDIQTYQQSITLEPLPIADVKQSQTIAMSSFDAKTAILARAHYQNGDLELPIYQYILLPYEVLSGIGARLAPLQTLLDTPIPVHHTHHVNVDSLILPTIATGNLNIRVEQLHILIKELLNNRFELAMTLLGAVLHDRELLIRNFPKDVTQRISLIQGLRMLLPSAMAMRMSFSTYVTGLSENMPQVTFGDDVEEGNQWTIDWERPQVIPAVLEHPYIKLLQSLWKGDMANFVAEIKPMDVLSINFIQEYDFSSGLLALTKRFEIDLQVRRGEDVETEVMIDVLSSDVAPQGRLRYQYIEKLLRNALNNRDVVAGRLVAEELQRDENLQNALSSVFDEMLESQPDTVYVFIRNRLNNLGMDESWVPRLQAAASQSLDIAIDEGDGQTLMSWLELIAREPQAYQLEDILRDGILTAQPRAHDDGELGMRLILIATRKSPDMLEQLYADNDLMNALPSVVGQALQQTSSKSLESLIDNNPEYFLLALFHATQTSSDPLITAAIIERLWSLYVSDSKVNLPPIYRPLSLIRLLGTQISHLLTQASIEILLTHIIDRKDNKLFIEVATHLANRDVLFPQLSQILQSDTRSYDEVQALMNWVSDIENVAPQNIIETYLALLDYWNWDEGTQAIIESLARLLAQYPSSNISSRQLWKLFEICHTLHLDSSTRVAVNFLLRDLENHEEEAVVVQDFSRIYKQISGNKALLTTVNTWWRGYTQKRSLMQLQRIDRELETQRILETPRQILQTAIAMRRLFGNRDIVTFAEAVNTAYSILENITDAFDKSPLAEVDPVTVRTEVDGMSDELSPDERYVLAKNLRELAQHITLMADRRSKPSLMRSDEAIDRQLMHGEADPQGSIDVMKWVAGYLDGAHDDDET